MSSQLFRGIFFLLVSWSVASGCGNAPLAPDDEDGPVIPEGAQEVAVQVMDEITTPVSAIPDRRRVVIKDQSTWEAYWTDFYGNLVPTPDPPAVDFSNRMVVVATMGTRPSAGYSISVRAAYRQDGTLFVTVRESSASASCANAAVVTAPAVGVIVDRWDGPVEFVEEAATTPCPSGAQAVSVEVMEDITTPVSGIEDRRRLVIHDQATWETYWDDFFRNVVPAPEPPTIDFSGTMVVVATMGTRPTGGYAVSIGDVLRQDGVLFVTVTEQSPDPACLNTAVITAPAVGVFADRWDGEVAFVEEAGTTPCSAGGQAVEVDFDVMEEITTPVSGVTDRRRVVIRDASTWEAYWNDFFGNLAPVPDLPSIDFSTEMVVVATMGTRPTGGYHVSVMNAHMLDETLIFTVKETSPGAGCLNTAVVTAPAAGVITGRWDGAVAFMDEAGTGSC